jgi:hypothetical protein
MLSHRGTILDATALIDFRWLNEWEWLEKHYSPLYISQELLDSDNLEIDTRQTAYQYLTPLSLETEEMFAIFIEFRLREPLLSIGDRSTLAIARTQFLLCASDDGLVIKICQEYGIAYTRTLRLLTEMVQTKHKTAAEVIIMANELIGKRGKHIAPKVLTSWKADLSKYDNQ